MVAWVGGEEGRRMALWVGCCCCGGGRGRCVGREGGAWRQAGEGPGGRGAMPGRRKRELSSICGVETRASLVWRHDPSTLSCAKMLNIKLYLTEAATALHGVVSSLAVLQATVDWTRMHMPAQQSPHSLQAPLDT
jgi:hypothetical protein